ncbi:MetQ/NlpA family ABC transporter substrate-binding protein, partial [Pseudomonas aeruginosa]
IFHEPVDQSTKMNVNVLAVAEDRQNDPELLKLKDLYHSEPVKQFIQEKFQGTKVDVNEPISYLTGEKQ